MGTDLKKDLERGLIEKCIEGDELAWSQFLNRYRGGVRQAVRRCLGGRGSDGDLIEEIEARVWLALWWRGAKALRDYDERRASLATYLSWQSLRQVQRWRREELRRAKCLPLRGAVAAGAECYPEAILREEAAALLTAQERKYFIHLCGDNAAEGVCQFSDSNRWKLHERVRRKINAFLASGFEQRSGSP